MNTLTSVPWQLLPYSMLTWIGLVAVAFTCTRSMGWFGVPIGFLIVATIIYILDVLRIVAVMQARNWDAPPDMGMTFMFGILTHVALINTVLLPMTASGLWLRRHRHRQRREFSVA